MSASCAVVLRPIFMARVVSRLSLRALFAAIGESTPNGLLWLLSTSLLRFEADD